MSESITRRDALKGLTVAAGALLAANPAQRSVADAGAPPHLSATDSMAVALAYHEDSSTVDAKAFPSYKPEQKCSNCLQLQGKAGDPWRPCNLFPGKLVSANGWCKVYMKKG
ncbi:MAG TPA: high-potential iron-sulfur protein [Steroidobacteraceae bacterium]|nr:high-potential iron-sulfur protein [Steroidobacteraceae bacterium]